MTIPANRIGRGAYIRRTTPSAIQGIRSREGVDRWYLVQIIHSISGRGSTFSAGFHLYRPVLPIDVNLVALRKLDLHQSRLERKGM